MCGQDVETPYAAARLGRIAACDGAQAYQSRTGEGEGEMGVVSLGYVGIGAVDSAAWADFGPGVLGMQLARSGVDGGVYLRMDAEAYRVAVHAADQDGMLYTGWEVASRDALETLRGALDAAGYEPRVGTADECRAREVAQLISVLDPGGNVVELFYGRVNAFEPFQPGRPISGFVADGLGLGHVVIGVADLEATAAFYTSLLGFRVSDFLAGRIIFLRCNARHHSLGIVQVGSRSLRHIMVETRSLDDVGTAYDLCQERGLVTRQLGRHTNDRMFSFYIASPSGFDIEYGWGGRQLDDATWRVFELGRASLWGHQPVGDRSSTILPPTPAG